MQRKYKKGSRSSTSQWWIAKRSIRKLGELVEFEEHVLLLKRKKIDQHI